MDSQTQFWNRCAVDRRFFWKHCVKIRTTDPESGMEVLVPFRPNAYQEVWLQWFEERLAAGVPVRYIVLKARQLGFTTLGLCLMFHWGCFRDYFRGQVIGHLE